jgi:hypothetical protein
MLRIRISFSTITGTGFCTLVNTGYRFLVPSEPEWRAYIDQAVRVMGATKIRTWFALGRHDIAAALAPDKRSLNLGFWQEMDRRLVYVQTAFPWVQVQVIVYAEDGGAVSAAAAAAASPYAYVAEYAQARWSSFPIVQWCVANGISASVAVDAVGRAIAAREPWGTLITSHQRRGTGYAFARASWSRIVTLQTLDALIGREVASYRAVQRYPVVLGACVRWEALIPRLIDMYICRMHVHMHMHACTCRIGMKPARRPRPCPCRTGTVTFFGARWY